MQILLLVAAGSSPKSTKAIDCPWHNVVVDLLGPLPTGHSIMVIVDNYSCYYEYVVMTSFTSEKVIDNVEDDFSHHGRPLTLKSDIMDLNSAILFY